MSEMDRLAEMLTMHGVVFERIIDQTFCSLGLYPRLPMRNQILVRRGAESVFSAVCHFGSYGAHEGLIEAWCFKGEPEGHLTAEQAFFYFMENVGDAWR